MAATTRRANVNRNTSETAGASRLARDELQAPRRSCSSASPVGSGPSSKTWPMCASQRAQRTSVRTSDRLRSSSSRTCRFVDGLPEARPARVRVVLRLRAEERQVAADAEVRAARVVLVERARTRRLRALAPRHLVLLGREQPPPLFVRPDDPADAFRPLVGSRGRPRVERREGAERQRRREKASPVHGVNLIRQSRMAVGGRKPCRRGVRMKSSTSSTRSPPPTAIRLLPISFA